ncbi:hypothetical protein CFP56_042324 [Quercus suber]|uniref:Uncharacterized protein n=1 Tax=Quercus suber TaxID=58331 RepID=A0AAW0LKF1_QUESU
MLLELRCRWEFEIGLGCGGLTISGFRIKNCGGVGDSEMEELAVVGQQSLDFALRIEVASFPLDFCKAHLLWRLLIVPSHAQGDCRRSWLH